MSKYLVAGAVALVFLALVIIGVAMRRKGDTSTTPTPTTIPDKLKGVTLSPKSFSGSDFASFFPLAAEAGDIISWHGQWDDLGKSGAGHAVARLAKQHDYTPIIVVHNAREDNAGLKHPFDDQTKADYKKWAADFVKEFKPAYFGIGIEINRMAVKAPQDFADSAAFFPEAVAAVKEASPETQVFTTFELNTMKGLNGGLFGGKNDPSQAQWDLLDKFAAADFFAWSVYPGIIYKSPADIPDDYLAEITTKTTKPVAVTEMGWPSKPPAAGWESNEEEQADFVRRFFELANDIDYKFAIWSFLFDQDAGQAFLGMGLVNDDGSKRPAWNVWVAATP